MTGRRIAIAAAVLLHLFAFAATKPPHAVSPTTPKISQADLRHMFVYERSSGDITELWDALSGKQVKSSWARGEVSLALGDPTKVLVGCETCIDRRQYSNDGLPDAALRLPDGVSNALFSPDARHVVFHKNRDIWIGDVDWRQSAVIKVRQLTEAGVFDDSARFWDGEYLLYGQYRVALATGKVQEAPVGWFRIEQRISPDHGVVLGHTVDNILTAYDVDTGEQVKLRPKVNIRSYLWLDTKLAVLNDGNHRILLYDRETNDVSVVVDGLSIQDGLHSPSSDGRYFVADEFMREDRTLIIDTSDWSVIPMTAKITNVYWSDNLHLFFSREAPLESRGAWVFDLQAKREVKVSPYTFRDMVRIPAAGKVIFIANNNLWRAGADGTEVSKLTSTDQERGTVHAASP